MTRRKYQPDIVVNVGKLMDEAPPKAIESECALLGSILLSAPDGLAGCDEHGVQPEDFYKPGHAVIYSAMREVYDEAQRIDMVLLVQSLRDKGVLKQVGDVDYLIELFESVPTALGAPAYAAEVRDASMRRKLIETAGRILHRAYKTDDRAGDQLAVAESELVAASAGAATGDVTTRKEGFAMAMAEIEDQIENGYIQGVRTGFHAVDEALGGLRGDNLYVVAARPGMGKTAFALQSCENAARLGTPSLFVSIEMPKEQVGKRVLAYSAGLSLERLRVPSYLTHDEILALREATDRSEEVPMYVLDAPGMNTATIATQCERLQRKHGIGFVVIDYLQLMPKTPGANTATAVGDNAKACKQLARRLGVPVMLLCQLNRGVEKRESRRPNMGDLRDSGEIEEAADAIGLLYREDYYRLQSDQPAELDYTAQVIVGKNRHGPTGVVDLQFRGGRFDNAEGSP